MPIVALVLLLCLVASLARNRALAKTAALGRGSASTVLSAVSTLKIGGITTCTLMPELTDDDRQWLDVFREIVESTDGKISPSLAILLDPVKIAALALLIDDTYAQAKARAEQDVDRLRQDARIWMQNEYQRICASDAFDWLRQETLRQAGTEADHIIADARRIAERIKSGALATATQNTQQ